MTTSILPCEEKRRYTSRKKARDAMKQLHRWLARHPEAKNDLVGLNVYCCPEHECWHVGHKPGTRARVARRRAR